MTIRKRKKTMRIDLGTRSSVFPKQRGQDANSGHPDPFRRCDDLRINELLSRVEAAAASGDQTVLPLLQVEMQAMCLLILRSIDDKLQQIHNKFVA